MVGELRSGMRCIVMSNMRCNMMCNMKAGRRDEQYEAGDMTCEQGDIQMIKEIDDIPYNQRPYGTAIVRRIINKKQQLGLSVNPNQILSQELHKPRKINFTRRKIISNHIDHIWGCDLITMIKYSKQNKNYKYILTVIDFFSKYSWNYKKQDLYADYSIS